MEPSSDGFAEGCKEVNLMEQTKVDQTTASKLISNSLFGALTTFLMFLFLIIGICNFFINLFGKPSHFFHISPPRGVLNNPGDLNLG